MTPIPAKSASVVIIQRNWVDAFAIALRHVIRLAFTVAVFCGCTYLVFWRGESGWLYVPAALLALLRLGL